MDKPSWGSQGLKGGGAFWIVEEERCACAKGPEASVNVESSQIWGWRGGPRAHIFYRVLVFLLKTRDKTRKEL